MAVLIPAQGGSSAISNGQIINGVANFWQTSAPTTRVGGAALVAGDLWYKPTDNGIPGTAGGWIWTGSDWVSAQKYYHSTWVQGFVTTTSLGVANILALTNNLNGNGSTMITNTLPFTERGTPLKIYVHDVSWTGKLASDYTINSLNTWNASLQIKDYYGSSTQILIKDFSLPNGAYTTTNPFDLRDTSGIVVTLPLGTSTIVPVYFVSTGTPASLMHNQFRFSFSRVHP